MAKYNHQPFEEWVYSRETISSQEELALQEHLKDCPNCRSLVNTLDEVESILKTEPVHSPAPGFTARWQTRLIEQRARKQKRQTASFIVLSVIGAVLLLTILIMFMWPILRSPYPFLLALVYQITLVYSFLSTFTQAGVTVMRTMLKVVPATIWISMTITMVGLIALWLIAFQRLVYPRRVIV